jgi:predicted metal-dependent hydrolase
MLWKRESSEFKGLGHGDVVTLDDVSLRLKVNGRARRISLRIDNKSGEAILSVPHVREITQAIAFARTRLDWVRKFSAKKPKVAMFAPDMDIPYRGGTLALKSSGNMASARFLKTDEGLVLTAGGQDDAYARRVGRYLSKQALEFAQTYTEDYAQGLGYSGVKVAIFDPKGRWGSCTPSRQAIRYSWRLIMAPEPVFAYVCAHEVAHLKHPHHQPPFWAEVERIFGDYKPSRQWLKTHGHSLFAYSVG